MYKENNLYSFDEKKSLMTTQMSKFKRLNFKNRFTS